ncbi:hypothetical protein N7504_011881 [Penicillium tannophilum]|nr:hypothetical protein N7504_011881 [Penicillium tannophilum]
MSTSADPGQPPAGAYPAAAADCNLYCWGCTLRDDGTHSPYCHWKVSCAEQARRREEARERLLDVCMQMGRGLVALTIIGIYAPDVDDERRMEILEFCERKNNILIGRLVRAGLLRNHNGLVFQLIVLSFAP